MRRIPSSALTAFAGALLVTAAGCGPGGRKVATDGEEAVNRVHTVRRGDFPIMFRIDGELNAITVHDLRFQGHRGYGSLKITWLVPDRSTVKSNDVVFILDDEQFKRRQTELEHDLQSAEESLNLARNDLEMIHTDNLNDLKTAVDTMKKSRDELRRYEDEEAPRKKQELVKAIQDKTTALSAAEDALFAAQRALTDSYSKEESEVEKAQKAVVDAESKIASAQTELDNAVYALRNFKRYDYAQKIFTLTEAVNKNTRAIERTLVNNATRLNNKQIAIRNDEIRIQNYTNELHMIEEDLERLSIRSPAEGTVFLGSQNRWSRDKKIIEGAEVYMGEVIGIIPDVSKFKVKLNIPEEFRSRVFTGLDAVVKTKAVPDLVLKGKLSKIAPASIPLIPSNAASPKVYPSEISTDDADERLTPGMTVQVEISLETVCDVLFVPVEAVFTREGKSYCQKVSLGGTTMQEVTTGRFSEDYVEITAGLDEGDSVLVDRSTK